MEPPHSEAVYHWIRLAGLGSHREGSCFRTVLVGFWGASSWLLLEEKGFWIRRCILGLFQQGPASIFPEEGKNWIQLSLSLCIQPPFGESPEGAACLAAFYERETGKEEELSSGVAEGRECWGGRGPAGRDRINRELSAENAEED